MGRLGANAGQAVAAWQAEDLSGLFSAITGYESGLRQLDEAAGIGIFSPVHERLRAIALKHGAVYKPSGAGGGDFGIALTDSRTVEKALRAGYADAGFAVLDAPLCAPGLSVRGSAPRSGAPVLPRTSGQST
jgi:mevalonate kinase